MCAIGTVVSFDSVLYVHVYVYYVCIYKYARTFIHLLQSCYIFRCDSCAGLYTTHICIHIVKTTHTSYAYAYINYTLLRSYNHDHITYIG